MATLLDSTDLGTCSGLCLTVVGTQELRRGSMYVLCLHRTKGMFHLWYSGPSVASDTVSLSSHREDPRMPLASGPVAIADHYFIRAGRFYVFVSLSFFLEFSYKEEMPLNYYLRCSLEGKKGWILESFPPQCPG